MSRILLYRTLGLGDFLTAVPAYRGVRRAFPACEIVLAAKEPLRPLAVLTGAIDTFLATPELARPCWHGPPPKIAVNLHGSGPESHALLRSLSPQRLLAFARSDRAMEGPRWDAGEHDVHRWCRLLESGSIPSAPTDLDLAPPGQPSARPGATVVHPGAASAARRWPPERFARVAAALRDDGHDVVVTGGAQECALAREVACAAGLDRASVLAGHLDLSALAALVSTSRLVLSGDTGIAHLATAYRSPSVVLFGPTPPALWGPPQRAQHRVIWHGKCTLQDPASHGVGDAVHPALLAVTVPEVLDAINELLDALKRLPVLG